MHPDIVTKQLELELHLKYSYVIFSKLSDIFHTCKPLESADELINWIIACWSNMAMVDYPHPASFLAPLPAWPVNVSTYLI